MTKNNKRRFTVAQYQALSRRRFLTGTASTLGAALSSAGIYELIDEFVQPPQQAAFAATQPLPQEQYLVANQQIVNVNGAGISSSGTNTIPVVVHPLHNHVITAKLKVQANAKALQAAQQQLESTLAGLEQKYPPTTSNGVDILVAWGLPYFHHYIPSLGKTSRFFKAGTRYPDYLPVDLATSKMEKKTVYAIQPAMTFPSDQPPAGFGPVHLEQNDMLVLLRSNSIANIIDASKTIFGIPTAPPSAFLGSPSAASSTLLETESDLATGGLFTVTSIRRGFAGGGFYGQQGLPSKLALAANIPGAKSIPPHAQEFLGFTTTLQANMGPGIIANLETLPGETDQWPHGYFQHGTTMALSHLFEDLATWYGHGYPSYADRVQAMLQPGLSPAPGTLTLNPPGESEANVVRGVHQYHAYGHTGSMSPVDSTTAPTTSNYGVDYPTGTTIPVRGDFDTLDNPFYYTSDPSGDHYSKQPSAGLHFIMFQPTIAIFNRVRLAMDGHYPNQTLSVAPRSPHAGINSVLFTTHRQNYLVPPRNHRSFPLAEF
jgi:hypothetical protein